MACNFYEVPCVFSDKPCRAYENEYCGEFLTSDMQNFRSRSAVIEHPGGNKHKPFLRNRCWLVSVPQVLPCMQFMRKNVYLEAFLCPVPSKFFKYFLCHFWYCFSCHFIFFRFSALFFLSRLAAEAESSLITPYFSQGLYFLYFTLYVTVLLLFS